MALFSSLGWPVEDLFGRSRVGRLKLEIQCAFLCPWRLELEGTLKENRKRVLNIDHSEKTHSILEKTIFKDRIKPQRSLRD